MAWNDYGVSQGYGQNGEQGVDLKTPFHTPITNLYAGTVVEDQYGGAGGIVGILTTVPGLGKVVEYFLHLDVINPNLKLGQTVNVGDFIGLSGGETPAQLGTYPGSHPASPQFSTGPHTEFGFFYGTPFASKSAGNPAPFLHPAMGSTTVTTGTGGGSPPSWWQAFLDGIGVAGSQATDGATSNPSGWWQAFLSGIGVAGNQATDGIPQLITALLQSLATSLENLGFFILALVLIMIGIVLIAYEPAKQIASESAKGALLAA